MLGRASSVCLRQAQGGQRAWRTAGKAKAEGLVPLLRQAHGAGGVNAAEELQAPGLLVLWGEHKAGRVAHPLMLRPPLLAGDDQALYLHTSRLMSAVDWRRPLHQQAGGHAEQVHAHAQTWAPGSRPLSTASSSRPPSKPAFGCCAAQLSAGRHHASSTCASLRSLRWYREPACLSQRLTKLVSRSHTMGPSTMACTSCHGCLGPVRHKW